MNRRTFIRSIAATTAVAAGATALLGWAAPTETIEELLARKLAAADVRFAADMQQALWGAMSEGPAGIAPLLERLDDQYGRPDVLLCGPGFYEAFHEVAA